MAFVIHSDETSLRFLRLGFCSSCLVSVATCSLLPGTLFALCLLHLSSYFMRFDGRAVSFLCSLKTQHRFLFATILHKTPPWVQSTSLVPQEMSHRLTKYCLNSHHQEKGVANITDKVVSRITLNGCNMTVAIRVWNTKEVDSSLDWIAFRPHQSDAIGYMPIH